MAGWNPTLITVLPSQVVGSTPVDSDPWEWEGSDAGGTVMVHVDQPAGPNDVLVWELHAAQGSPAGAFTGTAIASSSVPNAPDPNPYLIVVPPGLRHCFVRVFSDGTDQFTVEITVELNSVS